MRFFCVGFVFAGLCFGVANAQAPEDLNDLMALRSKVMTEAHRLQMELRQTWNDPAYTSPEIEALREKVKALQEAIVRTQTEIGAKVEALPALQEKVRKMKEANEQVEKLNRKIEAKVNS